MVYDEFDFGERTVNDLIRRRVESWPDLTATMHREGDNWIKTSWREFGELISCFAIGLRRLGLKPGQAVSILANTCRNWQITDWGIVTAGGITVGVYTTLTPEQARFIIDHSESVILVVGDKGLFEKVMKIRGNLPNIGNIIVMDPEGVDVEQEGVLSWDQVIELGRGAAPEEVEQYREDRKGIDPENIVTYIYTSGTTGPPKGAMLNHTNLLFAMRFYGSVIGLGKGESSLSFLPLAHALQRILDCLTYYVGATVCFARSINTVRDDIKVVRPSAMGSVPRIFEKIYSGVQHEAGQKGTLARGIFNWSMDVGRQYSRCIQSKRPLPLGLRLRYRLAYMLVFRNVKQALGGKIRIFGSGGAPISPEIQEFFHACGIIILEAWGLTETTAMGTLTRPDTFKFSTVGFAASGVEIKLDQDGEILMKGPNVFSGYFKDPEKTREAFVDGWFRSGDVGEFDDEGFLRITDRKKDLIITAYGENIAPQNIENTLRANRYISQAVAYGDRQKFLVGLITLDPDEVHRWAGEQGIEFKDMKELAEHPRMRDLIEEVVDKSNSQLASFEAIRRFAILPRDLTIEDGEITPTLKIKRKVVNQKYENIIRDLYGEEWIG